MVGGCPFCLYVKINYNYIPRNRLICVWLTCCAQMEATRRWQISRIADKFNGKKAMFCIFNSIRCQNKCYKLQYSDSKGIMLYVRITRAYFPDRINHFSSYTCRAATLPMHIKQSRNELCAYVSFQNSAAWNTIRNASWFSSPPPFIKRAMK